MKPDVIIAFAFGTSHLVNEEIAKRAERLAALNIVPVVTQRDIPINEKYFEVYFIEVKPGRHLSTFMIAKEFLYEALREPWRNILVVATPPHIDRCVRDLKKLKKPWQKVEADNNLSKTFSNCFWYSKNSDQRWTRSPFLWWLHEIPLRLIPFWLYKKIA